MTIDAVRRLALAAPLVLAAAAGAATIVQEGGLPGEAGPPRQHVITLDQFDTVGGTRELNFVRLDFSIELFAEGVTNGSGGSAELFAALSAEYYLDNVLIAETEAIIDEVLENTGPPLAILYFDDDMATVTYDLPADLAPWIGAGTIDMRGVTQLILTDSPPGLVEFGAGGSVTYTVTYDYDDAAPCPADLDGDGSVGFADLNDLLAAWGACPVPPPACAADLDGDGSVGFSDLNELLATWGSCA